MYVYVRAITDCTRREGGRGLTAGQFRTANLAVRPSIKKREGERELLLLLSLSHSLSPFDWAPLICQLGREGDFAPYRFLTDSFFIAEVVPGEAPG